VRENPNYQLRAPGETIARAQPETMEPNNQTHVQAAEGKSSGALVGSIIIIILLIIGAIYIIGKSQTGANGAESGSNTNPSASEGGASLSSSDSLDSIQGDLNTVNDSKINSADQGLQ
jgi:hypothetical protein